MIPLYEPGTGIDIAVVASLAWGAKMRPIKNRDMGGELAFGGRS